LISELRCPALDLEIGPVWTFAHGEPRFVERDGRTLTFDALPRRIYFWRSSLCSSADRDPKNLVRRRLDGAIFPLRYALRADIS